MREAEPDYARLHARAIVRLAAAQKVVEAARRDVEGHRLTSGNIGGTGNKDAAEALAQALQEYDDRLKPAPEGLAAGESRA